MTRVLFCCWPFEGHVFPQMSIALALRERGCEVAFYTGRRMHRTLDAEGVTVFGFARIESAWLSVQRFEKQVGGRRQSLRVLHSATRDWLLGTIPGQLEDITSIVEEWEPDVLVTDASMWGPSLILNELLPIPVALASPLIMAAIPGPEEPPPAFLPRAPAGSVRARVLKSVMPGARQLLSRGMRGRLDELRAERGLPPMGAPVNEYLGRLALYLVLNVPELDLNRGDLPASVRYAGACTWHPAEPEGTSEWLEGLPTDRPWVHVTEGTSHFQDPFVLQAAATGLAGGRLEAIITHGRDRQPQELGIDAAAANVHLTPWLSHDVLLPRCQALVTTGGAGTVIAGLRAGVPLVIVPTTWDKPDNAYRVAAAGAGIVLSPRRCTPASLREAVERVLTEPSYRAAAQRCAALLEQAPGPAGAAAWLEQLAGSPAGRDAIVESCDKPSETGSDGDGLSAALAGARANGTGTPGAREAIERNMS